MVYFVGNEAIFLNNQQSYMWEELKRNSYKYQESMDKEKRKQVGVYYTDLDLTDVMIGQLFEKMDEKFKNDIFSKTFFEPCVGLGNFVFSYLKYIHTHFSYSKEDIKRLVSNIYVCDSDMKSIEIFLEELKEFTKIFFGIELNSDYVYKNVGKELIFNTKSRRTDLIEPKDYFGFDRFDIIVTNPPYKSFRAESKHYVSDKKYNDDKQYYAFLKNKIKNNFVLQGKGSPNLYKLFVEEIIKKYLSKNGYSYLLVPQSILKNQSSCDLRKYILSNMDILHIYNIDEQSNYVNAKQALSALLIKNNYGTRDFPVIDHFGTSKEVKMTVNSKKVYNNVNCSIVALPDDKMELLEKMKACNKIKDIAYISNYRGELDLTLNKNYIGKKGVIPLIRGRSLAPFLLKQSKFEEFVNKDFIEKSKRKSTFNERIACPQISNMNRNKRLFFSYIPGNYVLGNSCNYIQVFPNDDGIDLYFLLGLLNSDLYDWYFKVFSSNNHISNYEINNLPVPDISIAEKKELSHLVKDGLKENFNQLSVKINRKVNNYFFKERNELKSINKSCLKEIKNVLVNVNDQNLISYISKKITPNELMTIENLSKFDVKVVDSILKKYELLDNGEVLNHSSFKLSDLDMEMVKSVSPGGNWKEIPLKIAKKSKRLMKIRGTGGRTTLYGRLDYSKPSYTITTYFNRPGNGTNIHPNLDRVLSVREAARIQSFPDSFYFYGNKKNKLTQIGNAVPPLMAYQIAKKIKKMIDVETSLDLFCGAGGMTTGFKLAGYNSIMMNDIDEAALVTAKTNYPKAKAFLGDLTEEVNRNYIIEYSKNKKVDIINGGPPCQGFSMAGFRNLNDPRSKLIYNYVEVLESVKPKVFVFENVQGLLSHNKGKTFKGLLKVFSDVGYNIEARLLNFSDFGIPQKRKRVIIIGVRSDIDVSPSSLFPETITGDLEEKITVEDAISDLENVPLDEKSYYNNDSSDSTYVKVLKNKKLLNYYFDKLKNKSLEDKKRMTCNSDQLSLF